MDSAIKEKILAQKKLRDSEFMSDPGISSGVSSRTQRQRVYLPLIEVENKSTERPLGEKIIFISHNCYEFVKGRFNHSRMN